MTKAIVENGIPATKDLIQYNTASYLLGLIILFIAITVLIFRTITAKSLIKKNLVLQPNLI